MKQISAGIFAAAAIALAAGGLAGPAVSHAEKVRDLQAYDSCVKSSR